MPAATEARHRRLASGRVYRLELVLGGAGLVACALVVAAGVRAVHVEPAAAHRLALAGLRFTYPAVNLAATVLLGLALLGAAVLVVILRAGCRQLRAHRRLLRALPVAGPLPGHPGVLVLDSAAPLAFCAGWLRPRVYVSRAVVARLSDPELRAVLAHEQHHGALRDPLRLEVGRAVCEGLFFLPVLRSLHHRYADAAELDADAAAVEVVDGAVAPLASAMLAFSAPSWGGGISAERVDALGGRSSGWRLPRRRLTAALMTLAGVVTLAWRASAGASLHATIGLPIASSQPCVLVLALVPVLACIAAVVSRQAPALRA